MSANKRKFQLTIEVESVGPRTRKKIAEMKKYGENMTTENNLCELSGGGLEAFSNAPVAIFLYYFSRFFPAELFPG